MLFRKILKSFSSQNQNKGILKDIKVIDLSRILAGPFVSMGLSDLGAEIIKIEPFEGDETRKWGPPFNRTDASYYLSVNRNKKSICVDLKHQMGKQIIYDLCKISDVVIENFSTGVTDKLQIDYQTLNQINPKIIYASISGFGKTGPLAQNPAFDLIVQAMSGYMHITGEPQGQPSKLGFAVIDVLTGLYLTNGIMAALYNRSKSGKGLYVETSLLESAISSLVNISSQYLNGQKEAQRMGNMHPSIVPYGVYKAKNNEYIVIGVGTNNQFVSLCKLLGIEQISNDIRFVNNQDRVKNRIELDKILENALQDWDVKQLTLQMRQNKIPGGQIYSIKDIFDEDQVKHLGIAQKVESKNYDNLQLVRSPVRFSDENISNNMIEPPRLNQHKNYVLQEILGYTKEKILELQKLKVIKQ